VSTGPPVDSAADITAFDISEEFVESCKKNRPTWHVQVADVQKLPYANGEFDVCVIYSSLHHIPINARDVMAELGRVTRGRIVFFEGVVPERGFLRWMLLLWYKIMDGGCHYYTEEELRAIFEKLPLRVERLTRHGPIAHMLFGVLDVSDAARA
jgi:ubiquinone/menaquinone biosynthesis C-methylase UbiE